MLVKIIKWSVASLVAVVLLVALGMTISAQRSLDYDHSHSQQSQALAEFSTDVAGDLPIDLVRIRANGMVFRARIAGFEAANGTAPPAKPLVILLHGFPVTSAMWLPLIEPLANAGFRVLAFDQRGYSAGARPADIKDYRIDLLSDDVIAIADAVGADQFHLIGHDWGSVVGWNTVLQNPARIISWTALSIAHPVAFSYALEHDSEQQAKSRYFKLFTAPWLPETLLSFNDFKFMKLGYSRMTALQRDEYLQLFSEPGALTATLNWYRAMTVSLAGINDRPAQITTPTLFLWGNKDGAVGRIAIDKQSEYMTGPYQSIELEAGHWLLTDAAPQVIEPIVEHLSRYRTRQQADHRISQTLL